MFCNLFNHLPLVEKYILYHKMLQVGIDVNVHFIGRLSKFLCESNPTECISGLSNLRPMGHMWPARQYCVACKVIHILIVLAELMKQWNQKVLYYDLWLN